MEVGRPAKILVRLYSPSERSGCNSEAVHSTDDQVASAIARAKDKMAGRAVGPAFAISIHVGAR